MAAAQRIFDAIGAQLILHRQFGDLPPRVGDEYEITEILGAGGFGLICRATQLSLRRQVALKLFALGDGSVREALREARSLARLEHPGIVTVYAAGESELIAGERLECAYVEMQLIDGVDLRTWLAAREREASEVLALLCAAGRALAYAHAAGIVHRDFKPENLMIDRSGRARVIDFGLALVAEAGDADAALSSWNADADAIGTRATGTGLVRGTPGYMAPEASQGRPRAASDQFALAVVVREALTGRHPFAAAAVGDVPPRGGVELFAGIKPIIDRAMAPSPDDRFASVAELCDALERPPAVSIQAAPTRRWPTVLLSAVVIVSLGTGGWFASEALRRREPVVAAPAPTSTPSDAAPRELEPPAIEPEPEPEPPTIAATPPSASEPSSCADLDAWMGAWEATTKVTWTEYAYQFDWRVDYEFELTLGDRCVVSVVARKYPTLLDGEEPSEPLETSDRAVALRSAGGVWRLPLRLSFPDDSKTYAAPEHYDTVLLLDRVDEQPRLRGAFRKQSEEGLWIRLGLLEGARGVAPDPRMIATTGLDCAARCRIDCAGSAAEDQCFARDCAPGDHPDDVCGPPSWDFRTPLRAVAAREALRDGEDPFAQALERGGKAKQLADCERNATILAGRWGLWLGDTLATLELRPDDCELAGRVSADAGTVEITGYVTAAGTWVLTPNPDSPAWLSHPLVLVGVGERGPAFGTDTAEPPQKLRAFRIE